MAKFLTKEQAEGLVSAFLEKHYSRSNLAFVPYNERSVWWSIGICHRGFSGVWRLTEGLTKGTYHEMIEHAESLNLEVLGLNVDDAASIITSTMRRIAL